LLQRPCPFFFGAGAGVAAASVAAGAGAGVTTGGVEVYVGSAAPTETDPLDELELDDDELAPEVCVWDS
jgi:hypothetical protein